MYRTIAFTAAALFATGLAMATPAAADTTCNPFELEGQAQKDCIDQWVKDICKAGGGDCSKDGARVEIMKLADGSVGARIIGLVQAQHAESRDRDQAARTPIRTPEPQSPRRMDQLKNKEMIITNF